jgi:hypothetical protein
VLLSLNTRLQSVEGAFQGVREPNAPLLARAGAAGAKVEHQQQQQTVSNGIAVDDDGARDNTAMGASSGAAKRKRQDHN